MGWAPLLVILEWGAFGGGGLGCVRPEKLRVKHFFTKQTRALCD